MTKKAREALLESIEHWHQNLDMLILNYLSGQYLTMDVSIGAINCALCAVFSSQICIGCPVRRYSGNSFCVGTPYKTVEKWINSLEFHYGIVPGAYKRGYELISKELEFLYSLLASEGRKRN